MKATEKVEKNYRGDLMQGSTKDEVDSTIIKDNLGRFILMYSSPLL